jgi:hypothetical protein
MYDWAREQHEACMAPEALEYEDAKAELRRDLLRDEPQTLQGDWEDDQAELIRDAEVGQ